jgi:hypothetical protein
MRPDCLDSETKSNFDDLTAFIANGQISSFEVLYFFDTPVPLPATESANVVQPAAIIIKNKIEILLIAVIV